MQDRGSGAKEIDFSVGADSSATFQREQRGTVMTKTEYRKYIASEHWQQRRRWFLIMHNVCNRCLAPRWLAIDAYDQDLHVHHKSYANVGAEEDGDLEALCKRCHEIETFGSSQLHEIKHWKCQVCGEPCFDPYNGNFCQRCEVVLSGFDDDHLQLSHNNRIVWQAIIVDITYTIGYSKIQAFLKEGEKILSEAEESYSRRKARKKP